MYINWAHYYIPKVDGALSFIINPLFIYIVLNEKKLSLGSYKYLLLYFSIFNMSCSLCDVLVPMVVHIHKYAFSIFIGDGPFMMYSPRNQIMIGLRSGFISGTYAILHAHFVYRFMVLFRSQALKLYFIPYGITLCVIYLLLHLGCWLIVCCFLIDADDERRSYLNASLFETYQLDSFEVSMLAALYKEGSAEVVQKSLLGMVIITVASVLSVFLYFILGYLTIKKLNSQALVMSQKTKRLQRQLMYALTVQSVIPTVVSFFPCIVSWYQPAFGVDLGQWTHHTSTIAVSAFPFLDPLAILLFIPTFRSRLIDMFRIFVIRRNQSPATASIDENVGRETAESKV